MDGLGQAIHQPITTDYIESSGDSQTGPTEELLYKGIESCPLVPHDETALAGYEVTDEYRMIKDYSIYVKLPITDQTGEFLLIWTTTPWTLPANEGGHGSP